jgi:hypothetical protein
MRANDLRPDFLRRHGDSPAILDASVMAITQPEKAQKF